MIRIKDIYISFSFHFRSGEPIPKPGKSNEQDSKPIKTKSVSSHDQFATSHPAEKRTLASSEEENMVKGSGETLIVETFDENLEVLESEQVNDTEEHLMEDPVSQEQCDLIFLNLNC